MKKENGIILCGIALTILISAGFTISQGTTSSADDNYVTPKSIIEELEKDLELEDELDDSDEEESSTQKKTSTSNKTSKSSTSNKTSTSKRNNTTDEDE